MTNLLKASNGKDKAQFYSLILFLSVFVVSHLSEILSMYWYGLRFRVNKMKAIVDRLMTSKLISRPI
jgi:hypothetical protein